MMNKWLMTLHEELITLALRRPLFDSEPEFQHELAWQLQTMGLADKVGLDQPIQSLTELTHVDLLLIQGTERIGIKLMYRKRGLDLVLPDKQDIPLKEQGAEDLSRYDFWKGVCQIETLINENDLDAGFSLLLTNNPRYWLKGADGTIDHAFRLHPERAPVSGPLSWAKHTDSRTMKNRPNLRVRNAYPLTWHDYSLPHPEHPSRYLMLANLKPSKRS